MKNNASDDINKLIEIPDIIVKFIETKEKGHSSATDKVKKSQIFLN